MPPEDNPADEVQPTKAEWEAAERARDKVTDPVAAARRLKELVAETTPADQWDENTCFTDLQEDNKTWIWAGATPATTDKEQAKRDQAFAVAARNLVEPIADAVLAKANEVERLRDFIGRMERVRRFDPDHLVVAWDVGVKAALAAAPSPVADAKGPDQATTTDTPAAMTPGEAREKAIKLVFGDMPLLVRRDVVTAELLGVYRRGWEEAAEFARTWGHSGPNPHGRRAQLAQDMLAEIRRRLGGTE